VRLDIRLVTADHWPVPDPELPLLTEALTAAGCRVDIASWRDRNVNWSDARLTLIRSPWDYVDVVDAFVAWVRDTARVSELWNPAELVAWNIHKSYLLDIANRGAPIVPTVVLVRHSAAALDGICDAQGWNTVVIKPAVGVGAQGSGRFDVGDPEAQRHLDELLAAGDVLVQPFVPSVTSDGETSVVLIDGLATHAVRKLPGRDDYRVHEHWGGRSEVVTPPSGAAELAARVCEVLPAPTLYARIDLLQISGLWHVLEVEVTEPHLWLAEAPPVAVERFVRAVMARLG
jgi:hypothetical protein